MSLIYFQGEKGSEGPIGPQGLQGLSIKGDKVTHVGYRMEEMPVKLFLKIFINVYTFMNCIQPDNHTTQVST